MNSIAGFPDSVNVHIQVNNDVANALIDSGSSMSYINSKFAIANRFHRRNKSNKIGLAVTGNYFQSIEVCLFTIYLQNQSY